MTRRSTLRAAGLTVCALILAACAQVRQTRQPDPARTTAPGARKAIPRDLLDELALLATNVQRNANDQVPVTDVELDRYIDALVNDRRFARDVAPEILIPHLLQGIGIQELSMVLVLDTTGSTPIYRLPLRKKCAEKEAVEVHPWWALDTTVKVCSDSYQPTHLKVVSTDLFCGAAPREPYCGCGPNLAFCARDMPQKMG